MRHKINIDVVIIGKTVAGFLIGFLLIFLLGIKSKADDTVITDIPYAVLAESAMSDSARIFPIKPEDLIFGPGIEVNKEEDLSMREVPVSYEYLESQAAKNVYQTIVISDQEFEELRWVVALEAQGEGFVGECAVVEAIFNRCLSPKDWGGSVHGVLSKKGQFSTYRKIGSSKAWCTPGEMEDDAISEVLRNGPSILPSTHYVFFDSKGGVNGRNHIRLGRHTFGEERI